MSTPIYENQTEYWDQAAAHKEFTTPFRMDLFEKYVNKSDRILDVGCGYGRTLEALYQKGYNALHGVDFSQKMIERGASAYPYLDLKKNENNTLPYADNSCDAVILIAVLTCIVHDKDQDALISEIYRVLKPNGIIYINDFLINTDDRNINRYNTFHPRYHTYGVFELPEGALLRHYTEDRIVSVTGIFDTLIFEKTVYKTMNGHQSNGFYYIGKKS